MSKKQPADTFEQTALESLAFEQLDTIRGGERSIWHACKIGGIAGATLLAPAGAYSGDVGAVLSRGIFKERAGVIAGAVGGLVVGGIGGCAIGAGVQALSNR